MITITGATGQLGCIVIKTLLETEPLGTIVAAVRDPAKAADLAAIGITVWVADYNKPETLRHTFDGVDKLLLISSSDMTGRTVQHKAVIDAAKASGVGLIAYTSMLRAPTNPAKLAREHRETESVLAESGLPTVLLRHGWYTENYLVAVQSALTYGAMMGSAKEGQISLASRADFAMAAARILTLPDQAGKIYELAGDEAVTLAQFAAEISRQSGIAVHYADMPQMEYRAALIAVGVPADMSDLVADADSQAVSGALFEDGRDLSGLIGRPTTPVAETIAVALKLAAKGGN